MKPQRTTAKDSWYYIAKEIGGSKQTTGIVRGANEVEARQSIQDALNAWAQFHYFAQPYRLEVVFSGKLAPLAEFTTTIVTDAAA